MKFLGIIPARGGSKGIKNKNIKKLNGKPLIEYTIDAAKKSKLLKNFIVSTDSKSIVNVVENAGCEAPFLRPSNLAKDNTPTLPVLCHALEKYEELTGGKFTHIVVLQPTAPLRTAADIDNALKMMTGSPRRDSLITCYEANHVHPRIMYQKKGSKFLPYLSAKKEIVRRQNFDNVYVRNGAIYVVKKDLLVNQNRIIGENPLVMTMPRWKSINIDDMDDFKMAELIVKSRKK